jgi:hypothetical protein
MSNTNKPKNEETLAIRLPKKLHDQLIALAQSKYMGVSTMARNVLAQYLIDEAPNALLGSTPQPQQPSKGRALSPALQAMSPAERLEWEKEWD